MESMNTEQQELEQQEMQQVEEILELLGNVRHYERSSHKKREALLFMVREGLEKFLIVVPNGDDYISNDFHGKPITEDRLTFLKCKLSAENAEALRHHFNFTRPVLIGKTDSYGFGDRLGNAGPAHLRAIRELERTGRTAQEVMDAAAWSVFQEGYHDGFGADGDHLKTTADIDRMVDAGYTMFTIDPSDFVVDEAKSMSEEELSSAYNELPWKELQITSDELLERFTEQKIDLHNGYRLEPTREEVMQGMIKYGRVITHTKKMASYLEETYPEHPAELELSVDETEEPTTLFEHYLVASELDRLEIELVSLAPRFCGHFEKGIDFKGDLDQFRDEYIQHLAIADRFGGYKMSIHSGSDKFSVYEVIGSLDGGAVHVKTAGTSYLEALRTVAEADPELFREILTFSLGRFEEDKKTYHISADPGKIPDPSTLGKAELVGLLDDNNARQVLHVAYGSVLSGTLPEAKNFKQRLMDTLEANEGLHEQNLVRHFRKHLDPFQ